MLRILGVFFTDPVLPNVGTEGARGVRIVAGGLYSVCGDHRRHVAVGSVRYIHDLVIVTQYA